ncbi:MAG: hypothetical protein K2M10_03460 [Muribaculaceae bacterium]|nr:hypothetical protein [Muribaculaceae bacterium]
MKTKIIGLLCLIIAVLPVGAGAQSNIKSAFDAIINCKEATITESHRLDRDPITKVKTAQYDEYNFVLPSSKLNLVEKVVSAFDKDSDKAYSVNSGIISNDYEPSISIGDGSTAIYFEDKGSKYISALFLAPKSEDSKGIYRYAYAISYKEKGGEITGKLVVTYAQTLQYRQQKKSEKKNPGIFIESGGSLPPMSAYYSSQDWFDNIMAYFQAMSKIKSADAQIAVATKAYKMIKNLADYPNVTNSEKETVREVLKGMIANDQYSDIILNKLLNQCLNSLK